MTYLDQGENREKDIYGVLSQVRRKIVSRLHFARVHTRSPIGQQDVAPAIG